MNMKENFHEDVLNLNDALTVLNMALKFQLKIVEFTYKNKGNFL